MSYFLFYLLCTISVLALADGLRRKEGVLQFQVLFSAAFVFSVIPQIYNVVFHPGRLPPRVYEYHGVELALIMCILCLVAGLIGFRMPLRTSYKMPQILEAIPQDRLFSSGLLLYAIGMYGAWKLAGQAGGFINQFTGGGHYDIEWRGNPVRYWYITKCIYPAIVLCLMGCLMKGNALRWAVFVLMLLYPLAIILFLGRRFVTFYVVTLILCCIWFRRKWVPARTVTLLGFAIVGVLIILMPYYRWTSSRTGNILEAARSVDVEESFQAYWKGEKGEGMDYLVIGAPARLHTFSFKLGTGFWDAIVDFTVPGQIIGYERKQALFFADPKEEERICNNFCREIVAFDSFYTGPYSVYREFFLFGCIIYFWLARFYKWLWGVATVKNSIAAQIWYALLAINIPRSVVMSATVPITDFILMGTILFVAVILPAKLFGSGNSYHKRPLDRMRDRAASRNPFHGQLISQNHNVSSAQADKHS